MATLQQAAAPHGLRFGPDPSTQARATLGGMIGNNACGPRAVAYGRTADNVLALDVVDGTGRRFDGALRRGRAGRRPRPRRARRAATSTSSRTELGRFGRQVSGYSLEHLLPENGHRPGQGARRHRGDRRRAARGTVRLVPIAAAPVLVVLGYPDMPTAADAVPALLAHAPLAIEGMDSRLVDVVRRVRGRRAPCRPCRPAAAG